jgi:hypothetical protein
MGMMFVAGFLMNTTTSEVIKVERLTNMMIPYSCLQNMPK